MSGNPWDVSECVLRLNEFREAREWARFHVPKELAAALAIEAGELQETMLWKSHEEVAAALALTPAVRGADLDENGGANADAKTDAGFRAQFEDEVADVAICLLMLAERTGVDLRAAILRKIEANERRYTVDEHRGVARKAPRRDAED